MDGGQPETYLGNDLPVTVKGVLDKDAEEARRISLELDAMEQQAEDAAKIAAVLANGRPIQVQDSPQSKMADDSEGGEEYDDEDADEDCTKQEDEDSSEEHVSDGEADHKWGGVFMDKAELLTFVEEPDCVDDVVPRAVCSKGKAAKGFDAKGKGLGEKGKGCHPKGKGLDEKGNGFDAKGEGLGA
eukprot:6978457-Pyramimonas_sp.AAC.1